MEGNYRTSDEVIQNRSIGIHCVPSGTNIDELRQTFQRMYPSIVTAASRLTYKLITSVNVRLDFRSPTEYESCKEIEADRSKFRLDQESMEIEWASLCKTVLQKRRNTMARLKNNHSNTSSTTIQQNRTLPTPTTG
ncbi:unnamed protein product [Didymodactylos carnosus]|uniref:Uncharacterized protein n=1 Tax=Didymodactylos carnosus TaxID=1234261 RepID=A0A8S2HM31_9BILA|nr:unnamed protein product [Didymodactylos carnosus]CAF3661355.1 unnamed protein product [Didymodactylos carnosus]